MGQKISPPPPVLSCLTIRFDNSQGCRSRQTFCKPKFFFDSSRSKLHIVPIISIRPRIEKTSLFDLKVFTSREEHLFQLKITIVQSPLEERKRKEEEEGGGARRRSIICSTKGEEVGAKSKGGLSNPPLPNGQTSRLSGNPAVYGFHKRGPSRERASYGSKIRDSLSAHRLCAPLTLFRG